MKQSITPLILLGAAVAAVPLGIGPAPALAQFQVDNSRTNDASNRLGSGGYNAGGVPAPGTTVNPNEIVTGNVTGGQSFRGPVPYRAVGEFTGPSATANFDRSLRDASSPQVSYDARSTNYANTPQSFYTSVSAPPEGFVRSPAGSGFVSGGNQTIRSPRYDERLGVITNSPGDAIVPRPGQLILPGPVDPSPNQTFIAASPLTGVRQFSVGDPGTAAILSGNAVINRGPGAAPLNDEQILRLRRELAPTLQTPDLNPSPLDGQTAPLAPGQTQALSGAAPVPFDSPENRSVSPRPLGSGAIGSTATGASNLSTGQGIQDRLPPPSQQSTQYAELQRRLDRYNTQPQQPKTDEERARDARAARQRTTDQQQNQAATPDQPQRPAVPSATPGSGSSVRGDKPAGADKTFVQTRGGGVTAVIPTAPGAEPVEVRSLATGVRAEGLRTLLEQAETNMRDGKFDTAINVYESAAQVAPNNPMILLGQANAELGGEYFARAENHLKQAFILDPALLMARYDLRAMIGDKRLDQVIDSLKRIAAAETKQSRPAFLLAYIAYNAHDKERAASYLQLAEQRAGAPDPVFRLLRSHWNLPADAAPDKNANK